MRLVFAGTPAVAIPSLDALASSSHELVAVLTRDLAAKIVRARMDGGAIVNFLRGLMNSSAAARDQRWQDRYDNLPRLVAVKRRYDPDNLFHHAQSVPPNLAPEPSA